MEGRTDGGSAPARASPRPPAPAAPGADLLEREQQELPGQQLRVQQQLRVRAAAPAHVPRHHRRPDPAGYPQGLAKEASRK